MRVFIAFSCVFLSVLSNVECKSSNSSEKHWALLIAGSNTWGNYRHQSDICHSYQILHKHGIPDENIVVMMYDDIAHNRENPNPGVIINKVGGPNVYKGVVKDYTKDEVTPKVFLDVLQGKTPMKDNKRVGSGKVIDSGPNDMVFVYFADHGAPGLIAFPDDELHAEDLIEAIKNMNNRNRYKKMVLYIEACESGSMFHNRLPNNINVYATTAASPFESSYACYFDRKLETYLGDVYSVKWMENSDKADLDEETLLQQFQIVKRETNTSHVMKYGDMSFEQAVLDDFQGDSDSSTRPEISRTLHDHEYDAVPSPDVPIAILEHRLKAAKDPQQRKLIQQKLEKEIKMRHKIEAITKEIASAITNDKTILERVIHKPADPRNIKCYKNAIQVYKKSCFNFNEYEYALRQVYILSNLCEMGIPEERILSTIKGVCAESL